MNVILQAALPCARIPVGPFLPAGIPFFLFSVPILLRSSWVGCQQPAKANHHKLLLFGSRGWRLYHSLVYKGRETAGLSQVRWILIPPLPPRRAVIPSSEHFVLLTSITSHDKCFYQEEVQIFPDPPQRQIKSLSHRHSDWKKKKRKRLLSCLSLVFSSISFGRCKEDHKLFARIAASFATRPCRGAVFSQHLSSLILRSQIITTSSGEGTFLKYREGMYYLRLFLLLPCLLKESFVVVVFALSRGKKTRPSLITGEESCSWR